MSLHIKTSGSKGFPVCLLPQCSKLIVLRDSPTAEFSFNFDKVFEVLRGREKGVEEIVLLGVG